MNIIITGGLGQDGQILINTLKKKVSLIIFSKKMKFKSKNNIDFKKENLLDKKKLDNFFRKRKPDVVLHLASNNPSYNDKSYNKYYKENFLATYNIFHSTFNANKKAKFIFCSSSKIFKKKTGLVNEKSRNLITCDYTKFRIKSHNMMMKYKKKNKINYTNAILFNHDSKFRNKKFLIPRVINSIIKKDVVSLKKIFKSNIFCDFSHAEDICDGLSKLIFSNILENKLIFSSGKATSVNEIIKYIIKKYKINIGIDLKNLKIKKSLIGNNMLSKKLLRWKPKKNIFNAVDDIYKFYTQQ